MNVQFVHFNYSMIFIALTVPKIIACFTLNTTIFINFWLFLTFLEAYFTLNIKLWQELFI